MSVPYDFWMTVCGVGVQFCANLLFKRPLYVGVHKYAAYGAIGYLIGTQMDKYRDQKMKEKEIILYDYISRHPEDFDEPPPKTFGEVFLPWKPTR